MRAAIYTRVSSPGQATADAVSLDEQERICRGLAQREGWQVTEVYCDAGLSATSDSIENRPALQRLLIEAAAGRFERVVCYHQDRIGRNTEADAQIRTVLKRLDIQVLTREGTVDFRNSTDKLGWLVKGWAAEDEAERIRARCDNGKRARAARGEYPVAQRPFGYRWDDRTKPKRPVEVPDEAEAVRLAFRLSDEQQLTAHRISDELNRRGLTPRRGGKWYPGLVAQILADRRYQGEWVSWREGGQEFQPCPDLTPEPLVTPEVWQRVQTNCARHRRQTRRRLQHAFLLNGVLFCECGAPMIGKLVRKPSDPAEYRFYGCRRYRGSAGTCRAAYIPANMLEERVWAMVEHYAAHPEMIVHYAELTERDDLPRWRKESARLERTIASCERQLERAMIAYETGDYELEEFARRKADLTRDLAEWRLRWGDLHTWISNGEMRQAAIRRVAEIAASVAGDLAAMDLDGKRAVLRQLDFHVTVGAGDWRDGRRLRRTGQPRAYRAKVEWAGERFLQRGESQAVAESSGLS